MPFPFHFFLTATDPAVIAAQSFSRQKLHQCHQKECSSTECDFWVVLCRARNWTRWFLWVPFNLGHSMIYIYTHINRYAHIMYLWVPELSRQSCSSFKSPSLLTNFSPFTAGQACPFYTIAEGLQKHFSLGNVLMSAVHIRKWFLAEDLSKSIKPH